MASARDKGIALAFARGVGPVGWRERSTAHGDATTAFDATVLGVDREVALEKAALAIADAERCGATLLLATDPQYPAQLLELPAPPAILFALGDLGVLARPMAAIVGTRHPTRYGERMAHALSSAIASAGASVVSGMAMGIDATAHEAALEIGGATIAVLGAGVDVPYPPRHRALHARIAARGLLLSESPCGRPPVSGSFPRRNRIIAALARVTIVVEAGLRSGALITAGVALELARNVAAVPGPIDAPQSAGTNDLLRDGAQVIASVDDALALVGLPVRRATTDEEQDGAVNEGGGRRRVQSRHRETARHEIESLAVARLGHEERLVWEALATGPFGIEALVARVHLEPRRCLAAVTTLEIEGIIAVDVAGMFARR